MTYFISLKIVSIVVGLLYFITHLAGALAANRTESWVRNSVRNYPLGVVLMLVATLWFVILTGMMDLGEISNMRLQLMSVWAIAGILLVIFAPGFLALRGLGCLLLLAAAVILDAAFLVQTPWRFVLTLLAYVWVIFGMTLVYSPHLGRDLVVWATSNSQRWQALCWPGVIFGIVLILLGLFVYPSELTYL